MDTDNLNFNNKFMIKYSKKFKNLALILLISVFFQDAFSQIQIQFNNVNEYVFNTKQVLNLSVSNLNQKPLEVYFQGYIKDGISQRVVDFKTNAVILNIGTNIFSPMTLNFSELNYSNFDISEIEEKSGLYPYGNYVICVQAKCVTNDCSGVGSTGASLENIECINVNIENPTPLILTHPENESEIEETKPLYSWIPPSPVASSSNLNYTMRLVEILEGQSKADALSMNRPLIEMSGIERPTLMHPFDVPELEKGKWYAWQVEAFVGNTPIAKSEQWKFKVKKDSIDIDLIPKEQSFIEIKNQKGESIFYAVGELKLRHIVRLENGYVNLEVFDNKGNKIKIQNNKFIINPGDNRLILNLEKELLFKHAQTYTLKGNLLNGESFLIKFIYINPKLVK